ncbi:hypothetical protein T484DRAFT_1750846 [Baffinella frigidus]|nr:hypothetical protein T484DRAFT_1750846 [Cryptophyta sp. CCMP2293]
MVKRVRKPVPPVECACRVQGAPCFGKVFKSAKYLRVHLKAQHGNSGAAKDTKDHNNKLQAARRKARRSTDTAWREAQCTDSAERRKTCKEEAEKLYEEYSDFDPEDEPAFEPDDDV